MDRKTKRDLGDKTLDAVREVVEKERSAVTEIGKSHRDRDERSNGIVGNDIPDESKERHTEIAVEAGRRGTAQQRKAQERIKR
jgi:hypothetical protein